VNAPEYDLVVVGSGPAGQKCAIATAKARKRVAVIDRTTTMEGASVHTGTIPSKNASRGDPSAYRLRRKSPVRQWVSTPWRSLPPRSLLSC
jgi:pyruvate/2-oxoglutarate dehydrogenase complex dihydrolipoamide dehydrogenase (E3) component